MDYRADLLRYCERMAAPIPVAVYTRARGTGTAWARARALVAAGADPGLEEAEWFVARKRSVEIAEIVKADRVAPAVEDRYVELAGRVQASAMLTTIAGGPMARGVCLSAPELARYRLGAIVTLEAPVYVSPDPEYARFFTFPKDAAGEMFPRPPGAVGVLVTFHASSWRGQAGALVPAALTRWPVASTEIVLPAGARYLVERDAGADVHGIVSVHLRALEAPAARSRIVLPPRLAASGRDRLRAMWRDLVRRDGA